MKTVDFSETIAASDLKAGRSRHLIKYMKICDLFLFCYESPSQKKNGMSLT